MHRWREKHPDHGKAAEKVTDRDDRLTGDDNVREAADTVDDTAAQHRAGVIKRDLAAKARRKGGGRG